MVNDAQSFDDVVAENIDLKMHDDTASLLLTDAAGGHAIRLVNQSWSTLCGWNEVESYGMSPAAVQREGFTSKSAVSDMNNALRRKIPCVSKLLNFDRNGRPFMNLVEILPLFQNGGVDRHVAHKNLEENSKIPTPTNFKHHFPLTVPENFCSPLTQWKSK